MRAAGLKGGAPLRQGALNLCVLCVLACMGAPCPDKPAACHGQLDAAQAAGRCAGSWAFAASQQATQEDLERLNLASQSSFKAVS